MLIAEFFVPGPPIAKGRPRVALRAGRPVAYTPDRTVRYESTVALFAAQAMQGRSPTSVPVALHVVATFAIPPSWPKSKRRTAERGDLGHGQRPDLDNVAKAALDGCNGIVWVDDAQVCKLVAEKRFGLTPGLEIRVMVWQ